ncbi:armadillo repeat-containing protein 2 [Drosophila innubila]|uniref:armadillo repeat-containing protein 2 n=1 Tax=Drosophila innubila TaxID=198719 RepID=UPI00148BE026|nr:armadillo repeat-containing protein 2 [Drosophila innubila]
MSLLLKRRSRSETRAAPQTKQEIPSEVPPQQPQQRQQQQKQRQQKSLENSNTQSLQRLGLGGGIGTGMGRRKTSAELISEAKIFLGDLSTTTATVTAAMTAAGGARLVSTRRPITPREPGRVLYGKVALAGRPPSAFSMRYLQNEILDTKLAPPRQLPALPGAAAQVATTTTPPARNGALLGQCSTETLIELLKQHAGLKDCSAETVQHINAILLELYTRVRKQERNFKRAFILGGLYGLVECTSPRVLLAVARVVLALRVTGSNLTGACKLIFKVARHEQHDGLFHENDVLELLIDGLGHASPLDEPEACIYAYGCIRFLTASSAQDRDDALNRNWAAGLEEPLPPATIAAVTALTSTSDIRKLNGQQTLVCRLARHGAVDLMILHLQMLNEAGATRRLSGPPLHTLYQLSAALRALADVAKQQQRLQLQLQMACPHLIRAAEVSMGELEVQANVVRTLSVLSEDVDCCETLLNYAARIGLLLGPCSKGSKDSERLLAVLSRLGYMLGNILAKHESARVQYYHNDVAMEYLLNVLQQLSERTPANETLLDAQIKLIRVVANMSVNAEVGAGLGNVHALGKVLLRLLKNAAAALDGPTEAGHPAMEMLELLHATLGALHNLCFYQDKQTTVTSVSTPPAPGSLQSLIDELSTELATALGRCQSRSVSTKVEIARVLGNLTRNELARQCFCKANGLPLMVQQLTRQASGQDYELRTCAIGVLVNLLGDGEQRAPFLQLRGAELLTLLLRGALEQEDWFLANIVCQALWNLLIDGQCATALCLNGSILDEVSELLADYLDEDRLIAADVDDEAEAEQDPEPEPEPHSEPGKDLETDTQLDPDSTPDALWEDFALVATDLLERIQNNFDRQQQHQQRQAVYIDNDNDDNDNDDVFIEEM